MQPSIYTKTKSFRLLTYLLTVLLCLMVLPEVWGQSCQLTQGQNGGVGLPVISPVTFERGNANANKSHFEEGNSVPYRVEFTTLQPNTQYKIRLGFDVKKNGKYAIDYITGFQNLKATSADIGETVLPILGTSLEALSGIATHTFPIPSPSFSSEVMFNSVTTSSYMALKSPQGYNPESGVPISGLSAAVRDKGNMAIWNGTINSIMYVNSVNTSLQTVSAYVEVLFTKANNNHAVVLAWGGHIASLQDWGQGNSASFISGSPYHMFVDYVSRASDGNMVCNGNMDCQLMADAVAPIPTCSITGPGNICATTSPLNYSATLDAAVNGEVSYQWNLTNLNTSADAALSGVISGVTSDVVSTATVVPASPYFTEGGAFVLQLRVERDGIINYCYYNASDSPGVAIRVNEISALATADPAIYSLNNRSNSGLSVSVILNGINANDEVSYQWSILNAGSSSSAGITGANTQTPLFTTSQADTFQLKVKLTQVAAPSCVDSAAVVIVVTPLQTCPTVVTKAVCANTVGNLYSASMLPAPGNNFIWSVNNGAQVTSVNGEAAVTVDAGSSNFDIQLQIDYSNPDVENLVCTYPVTVNPLPVLSTGSYGPLCANSLPVSLEGLPSGGSWSGLGVNGNMFDPSVANAGSHVLVYTYTDMNGCSNSDSTVLVVNANPQVNPGVYGPYCANSSPVTLVGMPLGGTWSGNGVSGAIFDPIDAGNGTHLVTYSYTNAAGCLGAAATFIVVNPLPFVEAGEIDPLCSDDSNVLLGGYPAGGIWSGYGVTGSIFNPASAGVGTHVLVYSFTDVNGCQSSDNLTVEVRSCGLINACTYTQGYYGSFNGKSCDEDSLYRNAVSLIRRLLSSGSIVIGSGVRTITLLMNDSSRVNAILPGGGTPKTLSHTGNIYLSSHFMGLYKGPGGRLNNNLLSQTITLALNIRIKDDLAGFVLQNGFLHTQRLRTCTDDAGLVSCQEDPSAIKAWMMKPSVVNYLAANGGATVSNLLNLANAVLGKTKLPGQLGNNGARVPSLGDITYQIDVINNAFDKCRLFLAYLPWPDLCYSSCSPEESIQENEIDAVKKEISVLVFPNPFQAIINFSLESPVNTPVRIELFEVSGRNVGANYENSLRAGEKRLIQLKVPRVAGPLIYKVVTVQGVVTGKLIQVQ